MFNRQLLKQNPLFSCFNDIEIELLADITQAESYSKNRFPVKEGDTTTSLYIVTAGKANAITYNHKNEKTIHNRFGPGDYFGEMSFIDGAPRCASVETQEYTEVLVIPRQAFWNTFSTRPDTIQSLMKGLLEKLRHATSEVSRLMKVMSQEELNDTHLEIIDRLVMAAEYKDQCTGGHISRIGKFSRLLAEKIGLPAEKINHIHRASAMHDIGKIGIPELILQKPARLTENEFNEIKKHTVIGSRILANPGSDLLKYAESIAMSHHEKYNGTGYPRGRKGLKIPVEGRIVAIVDAYDAIRSKRPYEGERSVDEAAERIRKDRGFHFDPEITDVFILHLDEFEAIMNTMTDDKSSAEDEDACREQDEES